MPTQAKAAEIPVAASPADRRWQYEINKMRDMSPPPGQVPDLVARVAAGDREALVELLARLRRMVALRLDPRLRGRVDASDVIQEGYVNAIKRFEEYVRAPSLPFYIWLRFLVGQRVAECHRRYLSTPGRDSQSSGPRPRENDDEKFPSSLRAGWNTLLFQVEFSNERDWPSLSLE